MKSSVTKPAAAVEQCQVKSRKKSLNKQENWQKFIILIVWFFPYFGDGLVTYLVWFV